MAAWNQNTTPFIISNCCQNNSGGFLIAVNMFMRAKQLIYQKADAAKQ